MALHTIRLHDFGHIARTAPVVFEALLCIHLGEAGHERHVVDVTSVVDQFKKRLVLIGPETFADGGSNAAQMVSCVGLTASASVGDLSTSPPYPDTHH